jgi:lysyl-tRNA synthetase class 2
MIRFLSVRQSAALGVAAVGIEAVLSAAAPSDPVRGRLIARLEPAALPSAAHVLAVLVGLALLVLAPKLSRGHRTAVPLAIAALGSLAVLSIVKGLDYEDAALALSLALVLVVARRAFPLGSRNRPSAVLVFAAIGTWALACSAVLAGPLASDRGRSIRGAVHHAIGHMLHFSLGPPRLSGAWILLAEALIGCAAAISLLALRSLLRPAGELSGHTDEEYRAVRAAVERHGEDSLSPFILRPDKDFHFDGDGVLAYRLIGETAVISGDPVAPEGEAPRVLASFREHARRRGWQVAVWGASARHLDAYRMLGLRAVCAGEEAFVDPGKFTLEGRRVRKLRQSVHRIERRGWQIGVFEGRELDEALGSEIDAIEAAWRLGKQRLLGFAMGMGPFDAEVRPDDLYLLGRSPEGELRAVMRFVSHCGRLSLDAMRRVHDTPNGLNEALVCRALEVARERGVREVSLNYAGLGHLARERASGSGKPTRVNRFVLRVLRRHFQMERLVRFNEKFFPEWRPRYLVCESRMGLPRATLRVLQAEGYLPRRRPLRLPGRVRPLPRGLRTSTRVDAAS